MLNLVVNYIGYSTRFLCPIETKSLEELDFIRVSRKLGVNHKNFQENYDIFEDGLRNAKDKQNKNQRKFRESNNDIDSTTATKRNGCDPSNILNIKPLDQSLVTTMNRLEQFSFKGSSAENTNVVRFKSSNSSQTQSKLHQHFTKKKQFMCVLNKYKENNDSFKNNLKDSNMHVTSCNNSEASKSKGDIKRISHYLSSSDDEDNTRIINPLKLKYPIMKDFCALEYLDESFYSNCNSLNHNSKDSKSKWNIIDPFNEAIIESRLTIGRFIDKSRTLMLLAVGNYNYLTLNDKEYCKNRASSKIMTYAHDVTLKYSAYHHHHHHQMLSSKTSFYIEEGINKDIALVAPFFENLCINTTLKKALISEKKKR